MSGWYEDKGLAILVAQEKAVNPGMVVGEIGDEAHKREISDHNPDPDGSVDAADFMIGAAFTVGDAAYLFRVLRYFRDPRIAYVIYNRQIFSSTVEKWTIREYHGSDPHVNHVHVSVNDSHHSDLSQWKIKMTRDYTMVPVSGKMPILKAGDVDDPSGVAYVRRVQRYLQVQDDGNWGPKTTAAMRALGWDGKTVGHDEWQKVFGMW